MEHQKSNLKTFFYGVCLLVVLFVIVLTFIDIFDSLLSLKFQKLILDIPTFVALIQLEITILGKISPESKTKILLMYKGFTTDTSVNVLAIFDCTNEDDYLDFNSKLSDEFRKSSEFKLVKNSYESRRIMNYSVIVDKTEIEFVTRFDSDSKIIISFNRVTNRQKSVANFVEKVNSILSASQLFTKENPIQVTTSIHYEKENPILSELLSNGSQAQIKYSNKKYIVDCKCLQINSGCNNQVALVKRALTGNLIED